MAVQPTAHGNQPHARPRITALANAISDPTPHTFLESMSGRRAQAEDRWVGAALRRDYAVPVLAVVVVHTAMARHVALPQQDEDLLFGGWWG